MLKSLFHVICLFIAASACGQPLLQRNDFTTNAAPLYAAVTNALGLTGSTTTFLRSDGTQATPAGSGDAVTSGTLAQFAPTTSAQLASVLSDEITGTFALFGNQAVSTASSPTFAAVTVPTGGGATFLVAATDSPTRIKAQADFVCDGTADEVQINAAIAALPNFGGKVLMAPGTFNIADTISIPTDGVTLEGSGAGYLNDSGVIVKSATYIFASSGFAGTNGITVLRTGGSTTNLSGIHLKNFVLHMGDRAGPVNGVLFIAMHSSLEELRISHATGNGVLSGGAGTAGFPYDPFEIVMDNVQISYCGLDGLRLEAGSTDWMVRNTSIYYNTRAGIDDHLSAANMYVGVYVWNNGSYGMYSQLWQTQIVGCRIQDNNGGIYMVGGSGGGFEIVGCIIRNNSLGTNNVTDGINIAPSAVVRGGTISGNSFYTDLGNGNVNTNRMRYGINVANSDMVGLVIGPSGAGYKQGSATFGTAFLRDLGTGTVDLSGQSRTSIQSASGSEHINSTLSSGSAIINVQAVDTELYLHNAGETEFVDIYAGSGVSDMILENQSGNRFYLSMNPTDPVLRMRLGNTNYINLQPFIADNGTAIPYSFKTVARSNTGAPWLELVNGGTNLMTLGVDGTLTPKALVIGSTNLATALATKQPLDADLTTWSGITPGTGVAAALAVNVGSAGAFVVSGGSFLGTIVTKVNADSPYTATSTDYTILCDAVGGAITINFPAAASHSGRIYNVKKTDSSVNAVTIDGNASETLDGATTVIISTQYHSLMLQSDGTNWHIL